MVLHRLPDLFSSLVGPCPIRDNAISHRRSCSSSAVLPAFCRREHALCPRNQTRSGVSDCQASAIFNSATDLRPSPISKEGRADYRLVLARVKCGDHFYTHVFCGERCSASIFFQHSRCDVVDSVVHGGQGRRVPGHNYRKVRGCSYRDSGSRNLRVTYRNSRCRLSRGDAAPS